MKKLALIAILCLCSLSLPQAQNLSVVPKKMYKTWISPLPGINGKEGLLFEVKDSGVILSDKSLKKSYMEGNYKTSTWKVRDINVLKVRRQGSEFAMLIGGISGMFVGVLLASWYENHLEATMDPFSFVLSGAYIAGIFPFIISTGIGIGVGAIFSSKISIPIRGKQSNFDKRKKKLNEYAILDNPHLSSIVSQSFSILQDSVTDLDGNIYHTLALGGQVWMAENLKVGHYRNGDTIPDVTDDKDWVKASRGASCRYNNDPGPPGAYGKLYNWNAVSDSRGLCPIGWHVPSSSEWSSLIICLGGDSIAWEKLTRNVKKKASGTDQPNINRNPFAIPGGFRFSTGEFSSERAPSYQWWTATLQDSAAAKSLQMGNDGKGIFYTVTGKRSGLSVRCLRD